MSDKQIATQADSANLLAVISKAAADPSCDTAKMRDLLDMQREVLQVRAEQEFNQAMNRVQARIRGVLKNRSNPQTNSRYVNLEALVETAAPIYTSEGFSLSFGGADCPKPEHDRVICYVSHVGGHTRTYQDDIPIDLVGLKGNANKTRTHAHGSTVSYSRRYLILQIFNLVMKDEDDDGNGAGDDGELVSEEQQANIVAKLDEVGREYWQPKLLKNLGYLGIADIPAREYNRTIELIEATLKKYGTKHATVAQ